MKEFDRHVSRLGTPYNDYCGSFKGVEEEETILGEYNALYRKIRITRICQDFLTILRRLHR